MSTLQAGVGLFTLLLGRYPIFAKDARCEHDL